MTSTVGIGVGSRLFLTAAPGLEVGSELSPGHWLRHLEGQTVCRHGPEGAVTLQPEAVHILTELSCEVVRLREFPHLPSRLDCLYLWADEAAARAWHYRKHVLQGSGAGLYEVEVIACQRAVFGDLNLVSYLAGETAGALLEQARRYWSGERTGDMEVLLEGSVVVRRNLLAFPIEALEAEKGPGIDEAMHASVRWDVPVEPKWSLRSYRPGRYHLEGAMAAGASLPMSIAGWPGIELEGQTEPTLARRGTPPLFVRPGETGRVDVRFSDLPSLPGRTRYRAVLVCDRSAAHYWQLPTYWEGRLTGDWHTLDAVGVA